jgi:hypothetical protein
MSIEELVVDCDVLVAHSILAILNLHDTVNQQEWVPARGDQGGTAHLTACTAGNYLTGSWKR